MSTFKPNTEYDSNPFREAKREPERGFVFMLFGIYIPVTVLAIFIRALMLYFGYPIISLRIVDSYILSWVRWLDNFMYALQ